ncbi:FtsX-like permease family protein [Acaryochloris sp. 'Moss Beach']|uniref:ABC transporter permease DevC n=1 Tax=Acaryochloris sp. 'Moss Beach' TaxID=2740837 RepID=UPI001F47DB53|nr:ABC transporter permease DevC [Acaryochloris sp. 'Moss Beach']UJB70787.1 FtsX-like permease family protein [Acaryochloris sp. 'Moss Beach']
MLLAIPLAWLQLAREKVRLCVALAGIGFAVILMMMQLGFQEALFIAAVNFHVNLKTDIVLINPQTTTLFAIKNFSRRRLYQAAGIDGVESVTPLYLDFGFWRNPETRKTRQILVIGFDPSQAVFSLPGVDEYLDQIKLSDVVLFDENSRPEYGPIAEQFKAGKTLFTEVSGRKVTVGGLFQLGASFSADGNLITSDVNLLRLFPGRTLGLIDIGLINVKSGVDASSVMSTLKKTLPDDVLVLSKQGFVRFEREYWETSTTIGFIFTLGTLMGFIVGMVIVYQILYTDVSDHLAEYATLKAMGYKSRFLYSVVLQEAFILAVLGFIPGFALCLGLYKLVRDGTALPMFMTIDRVATVFVLTLIMCVISGGIAMRRVQAADPADIF